MKALKRKSAMERAAACDYNEAMAYPTRSSHRRPPRAAAKSVAAIATVMLLLGIAIGPATAQDYTVDQQLSQGLTTDLRSHLLPLVGAQVGKDAAGDRRVVLYGYVATQKGKSDAESRTLAYLGSPAPQIVNHIVIQPEIATLHAPANNAASGQALGSANDYSGYSGGATAGESFDQVYQQIQRYGVHAVPDENDLGAP
jgi:hypothetical protein